jgi:hypothetical protein
VGRLAESIAPMPGATALVHEQVRRRQRRRAVVAVLASAAVVAAVAGTGFALSRHTVVQPGSAGPTVTASTDFDLFSCPEEHRVFTDPVPPIEDLAEQQATIESIEAEPWDGFTIERTAASPLGVVAMIEGDLAGARSALGAVGVPIVYNWDPQLDGGGMGYLDWVIQWRLDPVVHQLRELRRDIDGYAGVALWPEAGAVVLQWKAPVPAEIQALAGTRPDRIQVIVTPAALSERDLNIGRKLVSEAMDDGRFDAQWSSLSSCADSSGLEVGIVPESLGDRRAELQEQLTRIAGVPVMVRPQERAVLMSGSVDLDR